MLVAVVLSTVVGAASVGDVEVVGRARRPSAHAVLAFGDSVPAGAACGCSSFPAVYGSLLRLRTDAPVTVDNEAVNGLDTKGLLAQLREPRVKTAVRRSDVFLLTIGANDFADQHDRVVAGNCVGETATDCVSDELASMRVHLVHILAEIRALRAGRPASVLVTGYWNVFEDGQVGRHVGGAAGLQASIGLTRRVNDAISSVSRSVGARYVDLFEPFQSHGGAIDSLLAPDGDHPDAAGHELIASKLLEAGLRRIS